MGMIRRYILWTHWECGCTSLQHTGICCAPFPMPEAWVANAVAQVVPVWNCDNSLHNLTPWMSAICLFKCCTCCLDSSTKPRRSRYVCFDKHVMGNASSPRDPAYPSTVWSSPAVLFCTHDGTSEITSVNPGHEPTRGFVSKAFGYFFCWKEISSCVMWSLLKLNWP